MNAELSIKNIMTRKIVSVETEHSFAQVKAIFDRHDFHHIPVIQSTGEVLGIISREDWLRDLRQVSVETTGKRWTNKYYESLQAKDLMTPNPMVFTPDDTVAQAAGIFLSNLFRAVPVVDFEGQLVGILTTYDLLKYAFADTTIANA